MSIKLFKSLLFKSSRLQQEIEHEQRKRWPDRFRLLKLKKIRLAIKDKLLRLTRSLSVSQLLLEPSAVRIPSKRLR